MNNTLRQIVLRPLLKNRVGYFLRDLKNELTLVFHNQIRKMLRPLRSIPTVDLNKIVHRDVEIDAPILANICLPPYHGPTDHDDWTPLMKIVKFLQPSIVVELGTAYGNATANICKQSPATTVYTVNAPVESQSGIIITYELSPEDIGRVYRQHGFANQVVQIYENTLNLDLSQYIGAPVVELAIIDACHDTKYVINDFFKIKPFMKAGGIILLHDTFPSPVPSHLDGSYRACLKLRRQGYDVRRIEKTWWGIWIKQP